MEKDGSNTIETCKGCTYLSYYDAEARNAPVANHHFCTGKDIYGTVNNLDKPPVWCPRKNPDLSMTTDGARNLAWCEDKVRENIINKDLLHDNVFVDFLCDVTGLEDDK